MIIGSVVDIQMSVEMRRFQLGNWGITMALVFCRPVSSNSHASMEFETVRLTCEL